MSQLEQEREAVHAKLVQAEEDRDRLKSEKEVTDPEFLYAQGEVISLRTRLDNIDARLASQQSQGRSGNQEPPLKRVKFEQPTAGLAVDGLELRVDDYLPRENLVERLSGMVLVHKIVLLAAPPSMGKTSLLQLYQDSIGNESYFIRCGDRKDLTLNERVLLLTGVDVSSGVYPARDRMVVIIFDDAQKSYEGPDASFWEGLIKGNPSPFEYRFVISATDLFSHPGPSPVYFASLPAFPKKDLILSDDDARLLLDKTTSSPALKSETARSIIVQECAGVIGLVRLVAIQIANEFSKSSYPISEGEVLRFFYSHDLSSSLARCFGCSALEALPASAQSYLRRIFVHDDTADLSGLSEQDVAVLVRLSKAGVLAEDHCSFTSALSKRFFFHSLFPSRSSVIPPSLPELVLGAVASMSSSILKQSVSNADDFPKEATFQHEFIAGLAAMLPPVCKICPELSKSFPSSSGIMTIKGEIDFYVDGNLRWGIELLIKGDKIGEHLSRFESGGKYSPLGMKDYVVVDFRRSITGKPTNVDVHGKRITIFFKSADFTSCQCIVGLNADATVVSLKH